MKIIKRLYNTIAFEVNLAIKANKRITVFYSILELISILIPLLSILVWGKIVDGFVGILNGYNIIKKVVILLIIYGVLQLSSWVVYECLSYLSTKLKNEAKYLMDVSIMEKMADIDQDFFDNPANKDLRTAAEEGSEYLADFVSFLISEVFELIALVSAIAMLLSYNWIVGLVFLLTYLPGGFLAFIQEKKNNVFAMSKIPYEKEKDYYKYILTGEYYAKELRIYNLVDRYKKKYNDIWGIIRRERKNVFSKGVLLSLVGSLISFAGLVVIIAFSTYSTVVGTMTVGAIVVFVGLAEEAGAKLERSMDNVSFVSEFLAPKVEHYQSLVKYENKIKYGTQKNIPICPSIEFRNVFFKYPGNDEYTINNLSFTIEKGQKIALIGVNGAGKTTIIKLLLRLYEIESGEILIDGDDICSFSAEALNSLFGVCFQDVSAYSLTLKENITMSDLKNSENNEALRIAIEASGAASIVNSLSDGLNSDMTREFNDEGGELSGGQWQKIALARAFFRNAQVVILDEPSSALDPVAEEHIFTSFKKICNEKSGILISHRLSSVLMVDEILLIENGSVKEKGTHEELINKGGKYAELYRLQAEKYMGGVEDENQT